MVLPQAMAWVQFWFRVFSLKFCGKSKKICGDISQVSPAFCMYVPKVSSSHHQWCRVVPIRYTYSQQMSPVIAFDIAVVAQKVKVHCCYRGPVWSKKVGWWCCCITNRSGWPLELLTELKKEMVTASTNIKPYQLKDFKTLVEYEKWDCELRMSRCGDSWQPTEVRINFAPRPK